MKYAPIVDDSRMLSFVNVTDVVIHNISDIKLFHNSSSIFLKGFEIKSYSLNTIIKNVNLTVSNFKIFKTSSNLSDVVNFGSNFANPFQVQPFNISASEEPVFNFYKNNVVVSYKVNRTYNDLINVTGIISIAENDVIFRSDAVLNLIGRYKLDYFFFPEFMNFHHNIFINGKLSSSRVVNIRPATFFSDNFTIIIGSHGVLEKNEKEHIKGYSQRQKFEISNNWNLIKARVKSLSNNGFYINPNFNISFNLPEEWPRGETKIIGYNSTGYCTIINFNITTYPISASFNRTVYTFNPLENFVLSFTISNSLTNENLTNPIINLNVSFPFFVNQTNLIIPALSLVHGNHSILLEITATGYAVCYTVLIIKVEEPEVDWELSAVPNNFSHIYLIIKISNTTKHEIKFQALVYGKQTYQVSDIITNKIVSIELHNSNITRVTLRAGNYQFNKSLSRNINDFNQNIQNVERSDYLFYNIFIAIIILMTIIILLITFKLIKSSNKGPSF